MNNILSQFGTITNNFNLMPCGPSLPCGCYLFNLSMIASLTTIVAYPMIGILFHFNVLLIVYVSVVNKPTCSKVDNKTLFARQSKR